MARDKTLLRGLTIPLSLPLPLPLHDSTPLPLPCDDGRAVATTEEPCEARPL
jgi:hypothetical protein